VAGEEGGFTQVRSLVSDIIHLYIGRCISDEVFLRHRWERRVVLVVAMDENKSGRANLFERGIVDRPCLTNTQCQHKSRRKGEIYR
jgi:hypothetical protein